MSIKAFFDDSGRDDGPVSLLAGWIGPDHAWSAFSKEWEQTLAAAPAVDYFRMVELHHGNGAFRQWTAEQRRQKLAALASIIARYPIFGIVVSVSRDEYANAVAGKISHWHDSPYGCLVNSCFAFSVSTLNQLNLEGKIDFVFDDDLANRWVLSAGFDLMLPQLPKEILERIGNKPVHLNDKQNPPLQAADMLTWHTRRAWPKPIQDGHPNTAAASILSDLPCFRHHWSEKSLSKLARAMRSVSHNDNRRTPHEEVQAIEQYVASVSDVNLNTLRTANPGSLTLLSPFPANGTGKYLLTYKCEQSDKPHLHISKDGRCLANRTAVEWGDQGLTQ